MKRKILFVLCLLFGLMFVNSGLNKFLNYMPVPADLPEQAMKMFTAFMEITWLMPLIGFFEIIGGVLIIIPRFRALGAIIITPIMIGIVAHHFTLGFGLPIPLVMLAILCWVIVENRQKYMPMIRGQKVEENYPYPATGK